MSATTKTKLLLQYMKGIITNAITIPSLAQVPYLDPAVDAEELAGFVIQLL